MPFVKLDCGILNSTLWCERLARDVFITALLMAEPHELLEDMPQLEVDSLDTTGWSVPAGWYGFVHAAGIGILHRAGVDEGEAGIEALRLLGSPEPTSRSREFDGRRLVRVDGGFIVLNFIKYREKDATTKERSRRWRERKQLLASVTPRHAPVVASRVIRHQAEAEAEAEVQKREKSPCLSQSALRSDPFTDEAVTLRAGAFVERYQALYPVHRHGARYAVKPGRDYAAAVTLCQTWTDDARLHKLAVCFLTTDHKFAAEGSRTIPQFLALASWCDGELSAWEQAK